MNLCPLLPGGSAMTRDLEDCVPTHRKGSRWGARQNRHHSGYYPICSHLCPGRKAAWFSWKEKKKKDSPLLSSWSFGNRITAVCNEARPYASWVRGRFRLGFVFSSESSMGITVVRSATNKCWGLPIGESGRDLPHVEASSQDESKPKSQWSSVPLPHVVT